MESNNLYSNLAKICVKFYDLSINHIEVAGFFNEKISKFKPNKILFIGGFFKVAKELIKKGYDVVVVDYTDEMVEEGKKRLPETKVIKGDIRDLPFENEFDTIMVIGRVFTHMYSDEDIKNSLQSIRKSLKPNGILIFDNYEDTKIMKTNYFNGKIEVKDGEIEIARNSSTEFISEKPFIINWKATYIVKEKKGEIHRFNDEMKHRAFSRKEIKEFLEKNGFEHVEEGDNFDETSFYSIGRKKV
ncbi:class I SAM-dependent methyltransferase [Candidatus Woesearchaeota archaeon]|nr:class I SAM-dependent methyltransferase [Candidatus Woesearchaeota archaeon]